MINRTLSDVQGLDKALVVVAGKAVGAGTSDPTGQEGKSVSIVRTGVGVYDVTIPGNGTVIVRSFIAAVAGSADLLARATTVNETTRTVTVAVKTFGGTATDLSSSEELHYNCVMKNSSAP